MIYLYRQRLRVSSIPRYRQINAYRARKICRDFVAPEPRLETTRRLSR